MTKFKMTSHGHLATKNKLVYYYNEDYDGVKLCEPTDQYRYTNLNIKEFIKLNSNPYDMDYCNYCLKLIKTEIINNIIEEDLRLEK